jgi:nucleotide-binding universal stress UspA family protein
VYDSWQNESYEGGQLAPLDDTRMALRHQKLSMLKSKLRQSNIEVKSVLLGGHPAYEKVLALINKGVSDLVVLGTSSKAGLKRFVLGSTAEEIMRTANRPVLTVGPRVKPATERASLFQKIVFATDFSEGSAEASEFASALAHECGAQLYFCHVVGRTACGPEIQEEIDSTVIENLTRTALRCSCDWCKTQTVLEHGDAAEGILQLARKVQADLIVLGPRAHSFRLTHMERGVTLDVLTKADCPVLTVR